MAENYVKKERSVLMEEARRVIDRGDFSGRLTSAYERTGRVLELLDQLDFEIERAKLPRDND